MKFKKNINFVSQILCALLIVVMAICITGCSDTNIENGKSTIQLNGGELGEGPTQFTFTVVNQDNTLNEFVISTNKQTVGDALLEVNLIAGEEGDYGLYVKEVNGVYLDYEKDGKYWAFYINDGYAMSGIDSTPIVEGEIYSFRAE